MTDQTSLFKRARDWVLAHPFLFTLYFGGCGVGGAALIMMAALGDFSRPPAQIFILAVMWLLAGILAAVNIWISLLWQRRSRQRLDDQR